MYNPEETGMAMMIYIFYLSKIYEFMDTVPSLHLSLCDGVLSDHHATQRQHPSGLLPPCLSSRLHLSCLVPSTSFCVVLNDF